MARPRWCGLLACGPWASPSVQLQRPRRQARGSARSGDRPMPDVQHAHLPTPTSPPLHPQQAADIRQQATGKVSYGSWTTGARGHSDTHMIAPGPRQVTPTSWLDLHADLDMLGVACCLLKVGRQRKPCRANPVWVDGGTRPAATVSTRNIHQHSNPSPST